MEELINMGNLAVMNTYSRFPLVLVSGEGCRATDANGKAYLDFVAGIAVNSLGHSNKKLVKAISEQAEQLMHVSNLYWNKPLIELATRMIKNSPFDKAFFCNSGAEAIEGSIKLARKHASKKHPERFEVVSMKNSFHGRTFAAVTATGQLKYQEGLGPLFPGVVHAQYNCLKSLEDAVSDKTCAVLIEPVQGEGGIVPAKKEFLEGARSLCSERDICLIFDEVQCGVGRTGRFFAFEHYGVLPDVAVLAKGLAGGVPIGALLAANGFAEAFKPGDHASTFGGNALATAAANVVTSELWENGLLEHVSIAGAHLALRLESLQKRFPALVKDVRGLGLMQGIELDCPVAPIILKCIEDGLLLVNAGTNVIRFVPPLIVTEGEIDEATGILGNALQKQSQ
jgi:predicted acetylornithine/succinylornithine family transaminase